MNKSTEPVAATGQEILNALSLRRSRATRSVPISQIKPPDRDIEDDPIFTKLYCEYLTARRPVYLTRVPLQSIRCGFYRQTDKGRFQYFCDRPPADDVASLASIIRQGERLPLHIYANVNGEDNVQFVAPDDVPVFRAYELLGVRKVPVVLLSKLKGTPEESALGMRQFPVDKKHAPVHLISTHPGACGKVPAFLGAQEPDNTVPSLQKLRDRIARAQQKIKRFHQAGSEAYHYHHTLHSTLFRLDESLQAVILLLERNMWHQAVPLLRTLYETSLNFYLDWLAPQQMHAFFALDSVLDNEGLRQCVDSLSTFERENGTQSINKSVRNAVARTFELVRNVRQKAELSPLGVQFYKNMYSFMSRVAHQDFEVVANFAHTLERPERPRFERQTMESLLMSADVIVAKVVLRVLDDVGDVESGGTATPE